MDGTQIILLLLTIIKQVRGNGRCQLNWYGSQLVLFLSVHMRDNTISSMYYPFLWWIWFRKEEHVWEVISVPLPECCVADAAISVHLLTFPSLTGTLAMEQRSGEYRAWSYSFPWKDAQQMQDERMGVGGPGSRSECAEAGAILKSLTCVCLW